MATHVVFKLGGVFFIISGALLMFFWILSIVPGGFASSPIPAYNSFAGLAVLDLIKAIIILVGSLLLSLGLILSGLVFIKIPEVVYKTTDEDMEAKLNRLQDIVWKILQKIKRDQG